MLKFFIQRISEATMLMMNCTRVWGSDANVLLPWCLLVDMKVNSSFVMAIDSFQIIFNSHPESICSQNNDFYQSVYINSKYL